MEKATQFFFKMTLFVRCNQIFKARTYFLNGFINGSECGLFVVMVNTSIAMENVNSMLFSSSTVTAIDAVVWAIVPMAREHKQAFCGVVNQ